MWFKFSLEERSIIDLTIKTVRIVKSRVLSSILIDIVLKILDLVGNKFLEMIYKIGFNVARRYVLYALRWGNIKAREWIEDDKYISLRLIMDKFIPSVDIDNLKLMS